jgi:hypothetical protein
MEMTTMQPPLKLEFTPQTAKVAQHSGYKLTSFATSPSLEFEPLKRREMAMQPHTLYTQSIPMQSPSIDAYSMAVAEADSFLNMGNFAPIQHMSDSSLPLMASNPLEMGLHSIQQPIPQPIPIQTTSTQTTAKSPQPRLNLNPAPPSSSTDESKALEPPPTAMIKPDKQELAMALKTEKEEPQQYFELLYQPNEKQRKSYKNENRYILPNPLTIVLRKQMKDKKSQD